MICEKLLPPDRVYKTRTRIGDSIMYKSITNIGKNPTFDADRRTVESHLFEFDEDIAGRGISVEFVGFIREERKFESAFELTEQMKRDAAHF